MGVFLYLIPIVIYLLYKWAVKNNDYFEKQGIPYVKPWPLVGSNFEMFFKKTPFVTFLMDSYNQYKHEKVVGAFEFRRPTCTINDPKIIKQLAVKEFDHFTDHHNVIDNSMDPYLGRVLTALEGQKWKDMRSTLSPAFTGSKMRQMFDFVSTVGQQTAKTMKDDINRGGESSFEFKALASKFSVDVIATCAFGIETNSFESPDNEFYKIARNITNPNMTKQIIKFLGFMLVPKIMSALKITLLDKGLNDFIKEAISETMKIREEKGIVRHDMIHLLMQAKKGHLSHNNNNNEEKIVEGFATVEESQMGKTEVKTVWTDNDLIAQCLLFFLAGFDTVSTAMSFTVYELVVNTDIQEKLYNEIAEMESSLEGKTITYEKIQGMKYLDQVISESLRKWPPAPLTERQCTKEFDLKYDDKSLHFTTNMNFAIPIYCFHHDPQYFPEPEKFDPERFSEENRGSIDPDTYLPFGLGPRNCIGSRFALMELKTIFYFLLLNFSIEANEKTQIPLEYEKIPFGMKPEKGIWATLKPRAE